MPITLPRRIHPVGTIRLALSLRWSLCSSDHKPTLFATALQNIVFRSDTRVNHRVVEHETLVYSPTRPGDMFDGYSNFPCLNHKNSMHSSQASSHGKFPWHTRGLASCSSASVLGITNSEHRRMPHLCASVQHNPTRPNIRHPSVIRLFALQNLRRRIAVATTGFGECNRTCGVSGMSQRTATNVTEAAAIAHTRGAVPHRWVLPTVHSSQNPLA